MIAKKRVLLRGPALTCSGYGVYARQIAQWLLEKDNVDLSVQVLPWGITPWLLDPDLEGGLIGEIMKRSCNPEGVYDVTIQVQLPNEWDSNLGRVNVGVTAAVETDTCNPAWTQHLNKMDLVLALSNHTKKTLETLAGLSTPVKVASLAFVEEIKDDSIEPLSLDLDTDFNFLIFGQLTGNNPQNDRKNIYSTLKWLCETFSEDPDVGIVIKTNRGRMTKIDRKNTEALLSKLLLEVRKGPYPKVHLLHGQMTSEEIAALYKNDKIKALVSLTRGEGLGLPTLEAAASGLPVIATNWSGHLDFMDLGKFIKVDYDLREIHPSRVDNNIFMAGSRWAEPNEEDAKRKLLRFRKKPEIPKEWATELKDSVRQKFNFESITSCYDSAMGDIL